MAPFLKAIYFSSIFLLSKHRGPEILCAFLETRSVSLAGRKSTHIPQSGKVRLMRQVSMETLEYILGE